MRSLAMALLTLLLAACPPVRNTGDDDDASAGDPCDDGSCDVLVSSATASCGEGVDNFSTSWDGDAVYVADGAFTNGCCPEFSAEVSLLGWTATMVWNVSADFCDCFCQLDASARVSGLPSGDWTFISPTGEESVINVP
jgi:hypothetical protein